MANYNVSVTQSIVIQPANISAGESTTYIISNPLSVSSYFTLETVRNTNGFYDSTSSKNTSGSFTLGTGITNLIQSDYIAGVIVQPGGGNLTFVPAVNITNSTLYLRGVGSNEGVAFPPVPPVPLLLDIYPSSVAYSLRKLRTAYTGSAIRVRRSSDNNEQDIGFDGSGVLNTATLLSFCGAGDGFVTTWYDQSGNGINATQTSATSQPQVVTSSVLVTNGGLPSILFINSSPFSFMSNSLISGKTNLTSFRVHDTNAIQYLTYHSNGTSFYNYVSVQGDGGGSITGLYGTPQLFTNGIAPNPLITRGQVYTAQNGRKLITEIGSTSLWSDFRIGGYPTFQFFGHLPEAIFYFSDKLSDRIAIETNINNYYGIY
jgi:hypothetical protein